jgi:hypothetical protein
MIQGSSGLGFLLEAAETLVIARPIFRKDFDRHVALQRGVASAINLAHAARAKGCNYLIRIEPGSRRTHSLNGSVEKLPEDDAGYTKSNSTERCLKSANQFNDPDTSRAAYDRVQPKLGIPGSTV